nr:hypothetical protein [uncultured bacterium]
MGDIEAASLGVVESILKYHPSIIRYLTHYREQCVVGSLTGVVASKRVTEASKGTLSTLGNRT